MQMSARKSGKPRRFANAMARSSSSMIIGNRRSTRAARSSISAKVISIRLISPRSAAPGVVRFGVSTHDEAELFRALETGPDYIALGPIYPTILKAMAFPPQGLPRLKEWKSKIGKLPLVGIGGITLERVAGVLEAGADSAAVVTDITRNTDPEQRARDWVKATRGKVNSLRKSALPPN